MLIFFTVSMFYFCPPEGNAAVIERVLDVEPDLRRLGNCKAAGAMLALRTANYVTSDGDRLSHNGDVFFPWQAGD